MLMLLLEVKAEDVVVEASVVLVVLDGPCSISLSLNTKTLLWYASF